MPQKFIVTSTGYLRYGDVRMHKHLLLSGDNCIGGGFYSFDHVGNRLLLDWQSYDYGSPKWHLLDVIKIPSEFKGMQIFYENANLADILQIEYY